MFWIYENGENKGLIKGLKPADVVKHIDKKFTKIGVDWRKDVSIRIFDEQIIRDGNNYKVEIKRVKNNGKYIKMAKLKGWELDFKYKEFIFTGKIYDDTDVTVYVLWESLRRLIGDDFISDVDNVDFSLKALHSIITQKSKLVLFFSKRKNWGQIWKYSEARKEMLKEGLGMEGRGIEGERPREFRYMMGYDFRTNEKDKDVPDGSFYIGLPFPFGPRNERRNANLHLKKSDWTELLEILKKDPIKLRCESCGLFESETNRIGQKTKFQKGHYVSHTGGGDVSDKNIFSICQYCNTEQLNLYDIDPKTGKKIWNLKEVISKKDYKTKLEIYNYLKRHIRKNDV